ncbi:MAG: RNA recognition motif domain-containing protein [Thermosynechococcaceae cyanobacterium]
MSIYVANLSFDTTAADLTNVFSEYGSIKSIHMPSDRESGRPRGFAFVELGSEQEEETAIAALDGVKLRARDLTVNKARPKKTWDNSRVGSGRTQ